MPTTTAADLLRRAAATGCVTGPCYVVAELDPDGNPISYLRGLAVKEFGPELTYRLTPDQTQAWRFRDRESAQVQADRFNSSSANPHLTVTELAAADIA